MSFGKMFSSFVILATFCHCMSNQGLSTLALANLNVYHFSFLTVGMSQKEVVKIMRKPYSYESFEIGNDIYDVWFYITSPSVLGQSRMVPQNLTPLAFKNGILLGWGYRYYNTFLEETAKNNTAAKSKLPLAMSSRKNPPPPPEPKDEEEPPPNQEGREMLEDDAEDDFDTW